MRAIRYLHIPKTGGTSLTHVLRRQYRSAACFDFSGDADADASRYRGLPPLERARIALFTGHAPIETGLEPADRCLMITILREPLSRVQSFCRHVAEGKSPYLRERFPPERFDLDEFLWSGNAELENLQTKMLINQHHSAAPLPSHYSGLKAITMATDNLFHRIAHFGIQSHFHESIARFGHALGWNPLFRHARRNVASAARPMRFEQRHVQRILELNPLDLELYRAAEARFLALRHRPVRAFTQPRWAQAASILVSLLG